MLNIGTRRELLERLIVSELVAKRGEGPLARKHFTRVPRMLARAVPDNQAEAGPSEPGIKAVGSVAVGESADNQPRVEPKDPKEPG